MVQQTLAGRPAIVETLLHSTEPAIRYRVRSAVLGENPNSPEMHALREEGFPYLVLAPGFFVANLNGGGRSSLGYGEAVTG